MQFQKLSINVIKCDLLSSERTTLFNLVLSNTSIQWIIKLKQIKSVTSGQYDEIMINYSERSSDEGKGLHYPLAIQIASLINSIQTEGKFNKLAYLFVCIA